MHVTYSRVFSSVVSWVNIFIFFFLLAAQFVGMASLPKFAFNTDFQSAAVISCLVVIFYTTFAGLKGVIIPDIIQFIVILLMIVFICIAGVFSDTGSFRDYMNCHRKC